MQEMVKTAHQEAINLHLQIKSTWQLVASSLLDFCKLLKTMRETKLYTELGHETFESYVEDEVGLKSRQAYYYISTYEKLGPRLLEENADIGITKLRLIADVPDIDRQEFLENTDVENVTVAELRKIIEEQSGVIEQLQMDVQEKDNVNATQIDDLRQTLTEELRAEIDGAAEKELQAKIEAARKNAAEQERLKAETILKEKEIQFNASLSAKDAELQAQVDEEKSKIDKELKAARAEVEKLEKQIKLAANNSITSFTVHFEAMQSHFDSMKELIDGEKDKSVSDKMSTALGSALKMLADKI